MSNESQRHEPLEMYIQHFLDVKTRMEALEKEEAFFREVISQIVQGLPGQAYTCDIAQVKMVTESITAAYKTATIESGISMLLSRGHIEEAQYFNTAREERKRAAYVSIRKTSTKKEA